MYGQGQNATLNGMEPRCLAPIAKNVTHETPQYAKH